MPLAVVIREVGDRGAVMRRGRMVEQGAVDGVYGTPCTPCAPCPRQLLAAVPALGPEVAAARRAAREELAAARRGVPRGLFRGETRGGRESYAGSPLLVA